MGSRLPVLSAARMPERTIMSFCSLVFLRYLFLYKLNKFIPKFFCQRHDVVYGSFSHGYTSAAAAAVAANDDDY